MTRQGDRKFQPPTPGTAEADGLTSIHGRIHCAATTDTGEAANEQDRRDTNHFLQTLAEIALAVAARRLSQNREEEQLDQ